MTSANAALIVGEPDEDVSGRLFAQAFSRRGVGVEWMSAEDLFAAVLYEEQPWRDVIDAGVSPAFMSTKHLDVSAVLSLASFTHFVVVNAQRFSSFTLLLSQAFGRHGVRSPNAVSSIEYACDKWAFYQRVCETDIAVPRTRLLSQDVSPDAVLDELGLPLVLKDPLGAKGENVVRVDSVDEYQAAVKGMQLEAILVQDYLELSGCDKRLLFVGGRFHAAFVRQAQAGEFRSNVACGGIASPCEVSGAEVALAAAVVERLGLEFAGLDIATVTEVLPGREYLQVGDVICLEANAMPAINLVYEMLHQDLAPSVVDLMVGSGG